MKGGRLKWQIILPLCDSARAKPVIRGEPLHGQTIITLFAREKFLMAGFLVQQGKLSYDERISHYWPAFGRNGKENITLRQVLTHTAGVPLMPVHADMRLIVDWREMVREMERLVPIWEPGSKSGYHGLTFGWILGETASRADGRTFSQIVQDEICRPLGIENELYMGASSHRKSGVE